MLFVGIDPGAYGALVAIDDSMEVKIVHPYTGPRDCFDCIRGLVTEDCLVFLEQAGAMAKGGVKQGAVSMFNYGKNAMAWISPLEGFRIPYEEKRSNIWQRPILGFFQKDESKKKALEFARKRFPKMEFKYAVSNPKQQGVVDALCMAVYIRAKYYQDKLVFNNKDKE